MGMEKLLWFSREEVEEEERLQKGKAFLEEGKARSDIKGHQTHLGGYQLQVTSLASHNNRNLVVFSGKVFNQTSSIFCTIRKKCKCKK